jgi:hypothetical protein
MNLELFRQFLKDNEIYFMKISSVGAELFHADRQIDRQTDMTKLTIVFRNFANAPKKSLYLCTYLSIYFLLKRKLRI